VRPSHVLLAWLAAGALATSGPVPGFDLQGHRGARGLAPENTLAGFQRALEIGVSTLEADLGVTRDRVVVVAHDRALNPALTRGPDGRFIDPPGPLLRSLSLEELRRYDVGRLDPASGYGRSFTGQAAADGARIPTLAELLALGRHPAQVRFNLETKLSPLAPGETVDPDTFATLVVEEVRRAGALERVTLQSFDWRTLIAARKRAPSLATSCLTIEGEGFDNLRPDASGRSPWLGGLALADHADSVPRLVQAAGCTTWSPQWRNLTRERVREAKALGLAVIPWTVNEPGDLARVIDLGVSGLITDYPDRAREVLESRGMPVRATQPAAR
jgi:glycerophosphoryl diester phosphodiesterase